MNIENYQNIFSLLKNESSMPAKVSASQWNDFLSTPKAHCIMPLLYWRIGNLPIESRPPEIIAKRMKEAFIEGYIRSLRMERQVSEVTDAFHKQGIEVLVLKGAALCWMVYPDSATRPYCDLDLLVKPFQVERARLALEKLGYKCKQKRFSGIYKDIYKDEEFIPAENIKHRFAIDLHWDLCNFARVNRSIGTEELFVRAVKVKTPRSTFKALHPVDALIYAAIHINKHKQTSLIWIYDIALLARRLVVPEDWEALQQRCVDWRGRQAVEDFLKLAQDWYGINLPPKFADFSLWPKPADSERLGHNWMGNLFKVHKINSPGIFAKIRCLFHLLFPHPEHIRINYPPAHNCLLALSYIRRWLNWFGKVNMDI